MSLELLVVEGCTYSCTNGATATLTTGVTSPYVKCQGSKAYHSITVTVSLAGYTSMPATFIGASVKVKSLGTAFVRGNQTVSVTLTQSSSPFGTIPVVVSIADAGQSKVKIV